MSQPPSPAGEHAQRITRHDNYRMMLKHDVVLDAVAHREPTR